MREKLRVYYDDIISDLRNELLVAPDEIRSKKIEVCHLQDEARALAKNVDSAKEEVKNSEAILNLAISTEMDPETGKAIFTNERARTGELARRKQTDPEYLSAVSRLTEAERLVSVAQSNLDMARAELEFQQNMMTTRQSIAELTAAELLALVR